MEPQLLFRPRRYRLARRGLERTRLPTHHRDAAGLAYIDDQGRLFPLPEVDEDDEEPVLFESEQIWFSKNPDGHYVIASLDGLIALRFAPLVVAEDGSDKDSTLFPLVAVEDANGNHQRFVYHPLTGLPQYVIDGQRPCVLAELR